MNKKPTPSCLKAACVFGLSVGGIGTLSGCSAGDALPNERPEATALFAPSPDTDAFYTQPAVFSGVPGSIINMREITYQPAGAVQPNAAWQLQYETRDVDGQPLAAVTTVVQPVGVALYDEPVVLTFLHAYDSLGAACTPSHTATGSTANQTNMAESLEFLPPVQALGWTLVIPDYEGPYHAFGAGRLSGQAALDAIRAALQFAPLGLNSNSPVGMWGYSGGAYAATWAAALQSRYAPDINLVGTVAGGTPVDLVEITAGAEQTESFPLLLGLLFGVTRAYPALLPEDQLNADGRHAVDVMRDSCEGVPTDGTTVIAGELAAYVEADDPYNTPGFREIRPQLDLMQVAEYPGSDMYLYHEVGDALVPIQGVEPLVQRWCDAGVPLNYYRSNLAAASGVTPVGIHTAGAAVGTPAALAYLDSRFRKQTAPITPAGTLRCN